MDLVLRYRMLSDESDHFVRDFEVLPDMKLSEFHHFLLESLGYEECMASIFKSDAEWNKHQEYTQMDMGIDFESAPIAMDKVHMIEVTSELHDRMIYIFDMLNARAFYIELVEIKGAEENMHYPRVAFEHATAPDQYDPEITVNDGSIFEEMMGEFGEFDGDDNYDDEY